MTIVSPPTQAGFLTFVRNVMGITTIVLPDTSDVIPTAYQVAVELANPVIAKASPTMYTLAVYNLAGSNLINFAQDLPGAAIYKNFNDEPLAYFAYFRAFWKINDFVTGIVQASSDTSTSVTLEVQDALKNLTLMDLQTLKDPFGRQYLSIAQQFGTLWGLT